MPPEAPVNGGNPVTAELAAALKKGGLEATVRGENVLVKLGGRTYEVSFEVFDGAVVPMWLDWG
jgi:hypothetical protein